MWFKSNNLQECVSSLKRCGFKADFPFTVLPLIKAATIEGPSDASMWLGFLAEN